MKMKLMKIDQRKWPSWLVSYLSIDVLEYVSDMRQDIVCHCFVIKNYLKLR